MRKPYPLHKGFTVRLLSLLLHDKAYGAKVLSSFDPASIADEPTRIVFESMIGGWRTSGYVPDYETVQQLISNGYNSGAWTTDSTQAARMLVARARKVSPAVPEDVHQILKSMILDNAIGLGFEEGLKAYRNKDFDSVRIIFDEAFKKPDKLDVSASGDSLRRGLDEYRDDIEEGKADVERIPTGFFDLDLALGGGMGRGELSLFFGGRKIGKSMVLVQIASTAVLCGLVVVYVSLELSSMEVRNRLSAGIMGVETNLIKSGGRAISREVYRTLGSLFESKGGDFICRKFNAGKMNVRNIIDYVGDSCIRNGHSGPDLIIVDYADDLVASSKSVDGDSYAKGNELYRDLRSMGGDGESSYGSTSGFDAAVATASQVQRQYMHADLIYMDYLDKSIDKASKIDLGVSICADRDELSAGVARLYNAVCRFAPGNRGFDDVYGPYSIDYAHGRMFRTSEVNQKRSVELWERRAEETRMPRLTAISPRIGRRPARGLTRTVTANGRTWS